MTKVLDVESSLETGSKEAAKRSDQRRKGSHNETVDLEGSIGDGRWRVAELTMKKKIELLPKKNLDGRMALTIV